jgi:AraC-like DNA-binding protein
MVVTSLASLARPLWRLLERYQIDPEFVFREAGLDPMLMKDSRSRYSEERLQVVWAKAAELIEDRCFGLRVAEVWYPTDLHALGHAFQASSTLRTALQRLARYVHVVDHAVGFSLVSDGERLSIALVTDSPKTPAEEDASWALVVGLCRTAGGEQLNPTEVRLKHRELGCQDAYERFFRCSVLLGMNESAIAFARADVDRPLPARNREIARANDRILSEFLADLRQLDLIGRVKTAISLELPSGTPHDETIAKAVFMSARTLRRKLAAEGTSYSQLLDAVRSELAKQYVADGARSLSEITFLLGFSELSAFSRAFKRWTGQTPSAFREAVSR